MTLTGNRALSAIAAPAKRVLGFRPRRGKAHSPSAGGSPPDSARELRRRSGFLTHAWVLVVALSHARVQRRATRRHLAAGRVVVCDRYTLDALVYLRYAYGERHRFRLQSRLIELLSPRPALAFHLDVPAETALARKHEQYGLNDLTRLARLYREEHGRLGVRLLDGERPREELCAEIGREAWLALSPGA
jgi:thymidylate kinase